jgi:HemY protein
MAVARAAIDAHEWQEARSALGGIMRANPTERVCLLMAEIEAGEHGDQGRVRGWLTRALAAPRDPVWTADGQIFEHWAPVSPVSGRLDAFEWRTTGDRSARPALELEMAAEDDATTEPVAAVPVMAPEPPPPARENVRDVPVRIIPAGEIVAPSAGVKGPRPMARAPDDPGPQALGEDDDSPDLPIFRPNRTA